MWTLHVEDFGRIEKADIEVSPLTLFVGDNNSGKSYLLSLIYGLMRADEYGVLSNLCEDSPEYQACSAWTEKALRQGKQAGNVRIPFDDYAYTIFENLFNRILESNQKNILRSIFHADISAGKINIEFSHGVNETCHFSFESFDMLSDTGRLSISFSFPEAVTISVQNTFLVTNDKARNLAIRTTLQIMLLNTPYGRVDDIAFLPTSRTGFLLTYPALTKDAFSRAYGLAQRQNADLSLTKPFTDFLGNLTTISKGSLSDEYQSIIDFIESNIIHGKILVSNDLPLPEFYYLPENMKTSLPMFLSSDVIKEVAPLILMLQYKDVEALFIEEPEMSLHPQLQQMMARTLIKLVNAGMLIFAATHSDTILQHVNNMIKLNNLPEARKQTFMERYGFDADDPISAGKISMYQFDVQDNGKTIVRALQCDDYGFEVPTFYDPLKTLMEQTYSTEPDADEE